MNWKIILYWNLYIGLYLPTFICTLNVTVGIGGKDLTAKPLFTQAEHISQLANVVSSTISPEVAIPRICFEGIIADFSGDIVEEFVEIVEGDAMISVMTKDTASVLFVVNRINQIHLISGDFKIGIRAINVNNIDKIENVLLQEIEYLQHCVEYPIGLFLDHELYKQLQELVNDIEYNIWSFPSTKQIILPKVAHLLYQMPWGERIASVEILAQSLDVYTDFMDAARKEHLCLMHFRSQDNIYVILGNKLVSNFKENGTVFAVPTGRTDKSFIADLPGNSYVLMESEIELKNVEENSTAKTVEESLSEKNILSSEILAISGPLLHLTKWLNESLAKTCQRTHDVYHLESCYNFLKFVEDWKVGLESYQPVEILDLLNLRKLIHLMTFEMFQKIIIKLNSSEEIVDLRKMASQNFVTNITTYFHYHQDNETSHEMKGKFGQVFNCQFPDRATKKFPFYFEGESVMSWRLKPDAWVAAGLTACVLGIMISLAILVFIAVRITVGDVFEGNPLSSIMLLLSLIVLFASFISFAMEYASDHMNSRITYEDAEIMNTLCAVRIFLVTLCYCITFSILLCRALMLASIGSEGGFLSHVNGYIQSVICLFSTLVQIGLSTQLLIVMNIADENISCDNILYGHWLWALLIYDILLLLFLVVLSPLIYKSQRNYREGILLVVGGILIFIIWCTWITLSCLSKEWRDAAIPLGTQATGWAVLVAILIPRSFLIVRGIERSEIAQALPSLTSLAFAQSNQFNSEQSVYECVNPAMRHCSSREDGMCEIEHIQSPSEIPTLPLRGTSTTGGRRSMFSHFRTNTNTNRQHSISSSQSSLPPSPNKITRF